MHRLLVWNGGSGRAVDAAYLRQQVMEDRSTTLLEMSANTDLSRSIADACDEGCETIVAAGGDGTVNAVVSAIMSIDAPRRPRLAIVPLGTANDFAGTLMIPDDVQQAFELSNSQRVVPIDVVRVHTSHVMRYFANVAAGGNSVRVTEEMSDEMKARWGALCYLRGGITVLADLKGFHISVKADREEFSDIDAWAVLVANGKTNAGRIVVAPEASPTDGKIDLIIIQEGTAQDIIAIVSQALIGNYLECEQVIYRQVKRFEIHSTPAMRFTIDGEIIDEEPVEFEVVAGAIPMFVGDQFSG